MPGHFEPLLVALSFVIAASGSYVALRLAPVPGTEHSSPTGLLGRLGVFPAAVALGISIWAMHFTGMAAFSMPGMSIGYRWDLTLLSLVVAVVFTAVGFGARSLLHGDLESVITAAIPMAAGILTMHFLGMLAMTGEMRIHFRSDLVLWAGSIALGASAASLWLTTLPHRMLRSAAAAMAMALAICGMHYTGMAAAVITPANHDLDHAASRASGF